MEGPHNMRKASEKSTIETAAPPHMANARRALG